MAEEDEKVRIGIVGCADIARKLCQAIALSSNATLQAIGSRSLGNVISFAQQNGLSSSVRLYGSYMEVVEDPGVDAVYLPLPTSLHVHWAVQAARHKKHVLLENPVACDLSQLDLILEACASIGVQFMDGAMWLHHPRTARMKELMSDPRLFGKLNNLHSTSTLSSTREFLEEDIRVKPDLDGLGALGDQGWYCVGAILWAASYRLPTSVVALPQVTRNAAGVILSCSASLIWDWARDRNSDQPQHHQTVAIFHCSFLAYSSMDLAVIGSNGFLHVNDFIIPIEERSASYEFTPAAKFVDLHIGWNTKPEKIHILTELPQETLMIEEFAGLVRGIKNSGRQPDTRWPGINRKTQLVIDAVNKSIDLGYTTVHL